MTPDIRKLLLKARDAIDKALAADDGYHDAKLVQCSGCGCERPPWFIEHLDAGGSRLAMCGSCVAGHPAPKANETKDAYLARLAVWESERLPSP